MTKMTVGALFPAMLGAIALSTAASAADLVDVGIAGSDDHVYYFFDDGTVTAGTTSNPIRYRTAYDANGLPGMTLVAVGIAGSDDHVYYWWREPDGSMFVTSGTTSNPMHYREPYPFFELGGQSLVAAGIAGSDDHVYYWWADNANGQITVSAGTSDAPQAYRNRRQFNGGLMQQFNALIAIGIAGSNDHVYYWWENRDTGQVSVTSGTSTDPFAYIAVPYRANLF
ncbi:MAG: hypothetical protein ACFCVH_10845 [Alphaproteobacteria bacterium]